MFCPNCGKQLADNAAFCDACGESVYAGLDPNEATVRVTPPVQQAYEQPPVQQTYEQPPVQQAYEQPPVQQAYEQPPVQQVYEQPQPAYAPPGAKKKKVGALRNLLASLPAAVIFGLVLAASALMCFQCLFSVNTMKNFAKNDIVPLMAEQNILDFAGTAIPKDKLEEVYELEGIKDMLVDAVVDVYENSLYGTDNEILSADTVISVLKDNADAIEEISGYKLTGDDYAMIKEQFAEVGSQDLQLMVGNMTEELDVDKEVLLAIEALLSPVTTIILLGIAALLLALMFLIRRFFMTTFIWGGALTLPGAVIPAILMIFGNLVIDEISDDTVASQIATPYIETALSGMIPVMIGFAVAGIAMIVLGIVLGIVQKSRRNKA